MRKKCLLICPDSFKGSMSAAEAAGAMAAGSADAEDFATVVMPVADGGAGTAALISRRLGGRAVQTETVDALGRPIAATYYMYEDGGSRIALIDSAAAVGLTLISPDERDIMRATSRGVGLLINDAARRGADEILLGVGDTAVCDGGEGLAEVIGLSLPPITVLCDVDNPLCGPEGAARVFAPQKGATPGQVAWLEDRLERMRADVMRRKGTDLQLTPGTGAGGGIGARLMAECGARLTRGIDMVLDAIGFDAALRQADLVLTGEGSIDSQTLGGKAISGVLRRAAAAGKPVVAFGGRVEVSPELLASFEAVVGITPGGMTGREAMQTVTAQRNLRGAVRKYLVSRKGYFQAM